MSNINAVIYKQKGVSRKLVAEGIMSDLWQRMRNGEFKDHERDGFKLHLKSGKWSDYIDKK